MSIEGIRTVSSYQGMQPATMPQAGASSADAAVVKTVSASDTIKKTTVYEGKEESNFAKGEAAVRKTVSTADLQKTVEKLNVEMSRTECRYSLHEKTNRVMISIVDKETKEVIKEFPVEEALDRISKALELAGLIVDEKL